MSKYWNELLRHWRSGSLKQHCWRAAMSRESWTNAAKQLSRANDRRFLCKWFTAMRCIPAGAWTDGRKVLAVNKRAAGAETPVRSTEVSSHFRSPEVVSRWPQLRSVSARSSTSGQRLSTRETHVAVMCLDLQSSVYLRRNTDYWLQATADAQIIVTRNGVFRDPQRHCVTWARKKHTIARSVTVYFQLYCMFKTIERFGE